MYSFRKKDVASVTKEKLSWQTLQKYTDDYSIYRHYVGTFKLGENFKSPFGGDHKPSFCLYYIKSDGKIIWKDHRDGTSGNIIQFLQRTKMLSYRQALVKIAADMGVADNFDISEAELKGHSIPEKVVHYPISKRKLEASLEKQIGIKSREWNKKDLYFWRQFGITRRTLINYRITPISHIFYSGNPTKADNYAYSFREFKDDEESLTIYQPYNLNGYKWRKSHGASVWYGWDQLPKTGKRLIITKSMKDIMSITENTEYACTGLQGETVNPKMSVIMELRQRFDEIYLLYDNDFDKEQNWGRIAGEKLAEQFGFIQIEIPDEYKCKDFSDLVKQYGIDKAKEILELMINSVIPF